MNSSTRVSTMGGSSCRNWARRVVLAVPTAVIGLVLLTACSSSPETAGSSTNQSANQSAIQSAASSTTSGSAGPSIAPSVPAGTSGAANGTGRPTTTSAASVAATNSGVPSAATNNGATTSATPSGATTADTAESGSTVASAPDRSPASVAPISPGNINQTVAPVPHTQTSTAPLTKAVDAGQVRISLLSTKKFDFKAGSGIGDLSGPALMVTVQVVNSTQEPVDLSGAMVSVFFGSDQVGTPLSDRAALPLSGTLAGGRTARGTYSFSLPASAKDSVQVAVSYSVDATTAVFVGTF